MIGEKARHKILLGLFILCLAGFNPWLKSRFYIGLLTSLPFTCQLAVKDSEKVGWFARRFVSNLFSTHGRLD
ncbi:MAG TPA: hypothetical protein DIS54_03455 [Candidatus Veblenbacteria bacterium]|nr:hypothetical protein [Candidatus Veblenbacteria bacterium]